MKPLLENHTSAIIHLLLYNGKKKKKTLSGLGHARFRFNSRYIGWMFRALTRYCKTWGGEVAGRKQAAKTENTELGKSRGTTAQNLVTHRGTTRQTARSGHVGKTVFTS